MSAASRLLEPGAMVTTDFSGRVTVHRIMLKYKAVSQSGIVFEVHPPVPKSSGGAICADWFEPVVEDSQAPLF